MSQFAVQRDLKFLLDQCNYSKFFSKPQLHIFPTEIINFSQIMMLFVAEQLGKHYMTGLWHRKPLIWWHWFPWSFYYGTFKWHTKMLHLGNSFCVFFKKRCGHTWETEKSPKQKQTKIKTFAVIKYDFELFAKHSLICLNRHCVRKCHYISLLLLFKEAQTHTHTHTVNTFKVMFLQAGGQISSIINQLPGWYWFVYYC